MNMSTWTVIHRKEIIPQKKNRKYYINQLSNILIIRLCLLTSAFYVNCLVRESAVFTLLSFWRCIWCRFHLPVLVIHSFQYSARSLLESSFPMIWTLRGILDDSIVGFCYHKFTFFIYLLTSKLVFIYCTFLYVQTINIIVLCKLVIIILLMSILF